MLRPVIKTNPITVKGKQALVTPASSPVPSELTENPSIYTPPVTINETQEPVQPTAAPTSNLLNTVSPFVSPPPVNQVNNTPNLLEEPPVPIQVNPSGISSVLPTVQAPQALRSFTPPNYTNPIVKDPYLPEPPQPKQLTSFTNSNHPISWLMPGMKRLPSVESHVTNNTPIKVSRPTPIAQELP